MMDVCTLQALLAHAVVAAALVLTEPFVNLRRNGILDHLGFVSSGFVLWCIGEELVYPCFGV